MTDFAPTAMDRSERIVRATFARLDILALAAALGVLFASLLFIATAVLLLRGAPEGATVGPHLGLLAQFLPGYSVSWPGAVVGLVHGAIIGGLLGLTVGVFWNFVHHVLLMLVYRRITAGSLDI